MTLESTIREASEGVMYVNRSMCAGIDMANEVLFQ